MPFYLENMDLINGKASQHLQYLPYGESFVEQKTTATYYTPYRFSGKEKDEETQYSYFGARYYDADLSVWLSVDPMASSRSWISPYNYCQWNPVGRVDPSGALDLKDNYVMDADGNITMCETTNDNFDVLYTMGADGSINKEGPSVRISKGTLNNIETGSVENRGENYEYKKYSGNSFDEGKALFDFFRENTVAEYSLWIFGQQNEDQSYIITTSSNSNSDVGALVVLRDPTFRKSNFYGHYHNHPNGSRIPSWSHIEPGMPDIPREGDVGFAKYLEGLFPDRCLDFRIYPEFDTNPVYYDGDTFIDYYNVIFYGK